MVLLDIHGFPSGWLTASVRNKQLGITRIKLLLNFCFRKQFGGGGGLLFITSKVI